MPKTANRAMLTGGAMVMDRARRQKSLLKTGALQNAILSSAKFSSIATDDKGVIQVFNVGAERMLGYAEVDVLNRITPADISDPKEIAERALALSAEFSTTIAQALRPLSSRPPAALRTFMS